MTSKVKRPARPLAQLSAVERHINKQVKMSNVIDRLYAEHDDHVDVSYRVGYETARTDCSSVFKCVEDDLKTQIAGMKDENEKLVLDQKQSDELIQSYKQKLLDQAKKHQGRVSTLKNEIDFLSSVNAKNASFFEPQQKFLVDNWRHGWKWISTWAFGLITIAATVPIPPEVLAVLPDHIRLGVIAGIAISGGILRFVNQSKPLPPADDKGAA